MSLADGLRLTIEKLQNVNVTVGTVALEGVTYEIRYFPDTYPGTLETAILPCMLVFIDDLTVDPILRTESFNARMVCYLGNTAEGIFDDLLQAEMRGVSVAAGRHLHRGLSDAIELADQSCAIEQPGFG